VTEYRNSFYNPTRGHDPEFYRTEAKPIAYRGYLIYQRIKGACWDVVKGGVCVGQYAGRSGAERFVDQRQDAAPQGSDQEPSLATNQAPAVAAPSCDD
jgi:hypothetical protein